MTYRPHGKQPKRDSRATLKLWAEAQARIAARDKDETAPLTDADFAWNTATKPRAKPQQREKKEVQQPLVAYLRKHLPAGSIVHAQAIQPVSENHRFAMARDGVQFGMPDLLVIVQSHCGVGSTPYPMPRHFYIEAKHPDGGKLSPSQEHTQALLTAMGCSVLSECTSVLQAVEWLKARGVVLP